MTMNKSKPCDLVRWLAAMAILTVGIGPWRAVRGESITEPATVFFGKVLGTGQWPTLSGHARGDAMGDPQG